MAVQLSEPLLAEYGLSTEWCRDALRNEIGDRLPKDPRQWTREDVIQWLKLVTTQHGLPEVPVARFLMNGKALCLMSPHMFLTRVPLGGKLLYKDFQLRLCAALYSIS
ncbi:hypothetical protein PPYR_03504 [Photinus pyralis]|uniref:PNT domain-containing protein n=1 Tax=Photinus pyralis TaxID=7054 RepID=A0A5N4A2Z0_PHOPY|nr:transcription factor ETV7 [Photinus pyralis]XP_031331927.1 transcription factor ETV7 [Photinus pyralis]KAB0791704.1 hypothetical protein PPYR_03504 [Photinus pyralis]